MKCPACGHAEMISKTQDETLSWGGQSLIFHAMRGEFCPVCGEGAWDTESYRRYAEAQAALLRSVKGDVSGEIRRIRKNLKLTQAKLAEAFGLKGRRVEKADQVEAAFQESLKSDETFIVELMTEPESNVLPMLPPGGALSSFYTRRGAKKSIYDWYGRLPRTESEIKNYKVEISEEDDLNVYWEE